MAALRKERDDGHTAMTTDNRDLLIGGVSALDLADEAGSADNIESGDTEKAAGVVDTLVLEDLGADGDGRVDRVADDEDVGIWARLSAGLSEVADDGGVGVEEVITGHAGLAGDTSRDEDDLGALEGLGKAGGSGFVALDSRLGVDV